MADISGTQVYVGEGLAAAGGWLNSRAAEIADELETLKVKLTPLADAWKESAAATEYQDLQVQWNVAADGLLGPDGVLGTIAHAMHVNWGNYSEAEWANIRTMRH